MSPGCSLTGRVAEHLRSVSQAGVQLHGERAGSPVTVLHVYDRGYATMRGKLLSVVPVLDDV